MHAVAIVLALLAAVTILAMAARRVHLPYPTVMVLGGLAICFIPHLPRVEMDPNLVFDLLLPPLLYAAAWQASWRDFRANLRPILLLAIGFVLFTTLVIGAASHWLIPGMTWPAALTFGAIISPPDAVAAVAIAERLRVPRRIIVILEGESLVNDATGLSLFRLGMIATVTGRFEWTQAAGIFLYALVVGGLIGLIVGVVVAWIHELLEDPLPETVITLLTPFASFLTAEALGSSPFLAVVVTALYLSRRSPRLFSPELRVQATATWAVIAFMLNGLVFVLIGLQLPVILQQIRSLGDSDLAIIGYALALAVLAVVVRLVWMFPAAAVPRWLSASLRKRDPMPPWPVIFLIGYTGMRGVDSLAAAMALPLTTESGERFPRRGMIIFLTFAIILFTLVLQSLSLPGLIRWLGLRADDKELCEEWDARLRAVRAGLRRIEELSGDQLPEDERAAVDRLRAQYQARIAQLEPIVQSDQCVLPDESESTRPQSERRINQEVIDAEHEELIRLRDQDIINDEILRRVERDLDLARLRWS